MHMDESVAVAFREAGGDPQGFSFVPKQGPPTPLRTYMSESSVLTVAVDDQGRRLLALELAWRRWAERTEVPTPTVRGASPSASWLLADRVVPATPAGCDYVHAGLDVADRISSSSVPTLPVLPSSWRASRRGLPIRALRSVAGGLDVRDFRAARSAAADLDDKTCSHGDFYRRNVLNTQHGVSVVDWEFAGWAPRYTDHLRFWSTLRDERDRDEAWQRISDQAADRVQHLRVLAAWMSIRLLAENLAAPVRYRDSDDLAHARTMAQEGRQLLRQS